MAGPIQFLDYEEALEAHAFGLRFVGQEADAALLDETGFRSALSAPKNAHWYEDQQDLFMLAALYAQRIAKNHPFADGNKRAAFICAVAFLGKNDIDTRADFGRFEAPMLRLTEAGRESLAAAAAEFAGFLRELADEVAP